LALVDGVNDGMLRGFQELLAELYAQLKGYDIRVQTK
jgi:hypothetical protein